MNTFLKTSLNTELVITILKGILILAASSSDKIDYLDDSDLYRIKQTSTIEMQKIKVKNVDFNLDEHGVAAKSNAIPVPSPMNARILETDTSDEEEEGIDDPIL